MGPVIIWVLVPIIVVFFFIKQNGLMSVMAPEGALLINCSICWIGFIFGGWEFVFKRLMPPIVLIMLAALVFNGLKSGYCATVGSQTPKCVAEK